MSYDLRQQIECIFLGVVRPDSGITDISNKNSWMLQYMNYLVTNDFFRIEGIGHLYCGFLAN